MGTYGREAVVTALLKNHLSQADTIVGSAGSALLKKGFQLGWARVGHGSISASIDTNFIEINMEDIKSEVDKWISQFDDLKENEQRIYDALTEPTPEQFMRLSRILSDASSIQQAYFQIKAELDEVEKEFENTVRVYRSPMRQALTAATLMYNSLNNIKGDFSDFENVSVYVHGIESDGEDFQDDVEEVADTGDVVVRKIRDEEAEYYIIQEVDGKRQMKAYDSLEELKESKYYNSEGRLHIVYDTEHQNEHRQETSDDLSELLTDMGLLNETTKIDMFGHSYGGRRSFQFAMDYPDHVRSITTIGTPYETNTLGSGANKYPFIAGHIPFVDFHPKEYSGYLDPNPENYRTDDGIDHSNVYTDMASESMGDDINHLKAANPEAYEKLEEMDITATAGSSGTISTYNYFDRKTEKVYLGDHIVSVNSQLAKELGDLIDDHEIYSIKMPIAHLKEIRNEEFIDLVKEVNKKEKE
ncbi:alpha/beta fold hydrolase [Virgibacillus sp. 179-BFC.A HS]|uniref:Alpha/beta fold hydrolase n=1 Tax=Tigheibacillus jepli TaxID=3035914 RepID=A0ABU5CFR9_9BACI|nr:alpha/beta fold hydrolase [Virgibacillus sp. 179-BFC.A HS]MDY0405165.1 alpha/beta fold hydrolase [Virgibacillus sp. 179-BFC.A HS]